jgi:hypothetical protein
MCIYMYVYVYIYLCMYVRMCISYYGWFVYWWLAYNNDHGPFYAQDLQCMYEPYPLIVAPHTYIQTYINIETSQQTEELYHALKELR